MNEELKALHCLALMAAADGGVDPEEAELLEAICRRRGLDRSLLTKALEAVAGGDKRLSLPKGAPQRAQLFGELLHVAVAGATVTSSQAKLLAAVGGKAGLSAEERQASAQAALEARRARGSGLPPELAAEPAPPEASDSAAPKAAAAPEEAGSTFDRSWVVAGALALLLWVFLPLGLGLRKAKSKEQEYLTRCEARLTGAEVERKTVIKRLRGDAAEAKEHTRLSAQEVAQAKRAHDAVKLELKVELSSASLPLLERNEVERKRAALRARPAKMRAAIAARNEEFARTFGGKQ